MYERAIRDFTQALSYVEIISTDLKLRSMYRRALAYFESHQYDEACKDLTILLGQDPNSVAPRALMARSYKMMSDLRRAEEQITHAITLEETQHSHYAERGDIRFRTNEKNKTIEAIYDFDKAAKLIEEKIVKMIAAEEMAEAAKPSGAHTAAQHSPTHGHGSPSHTHTHAHAHAHTNAHTHTHAHEEQEAVAGGKLVNGLRNAVASASSGEHGGEGDQETALDESNNNAVVASESQDAEDDGGSESSPVQGEESSEHEGGGGEGGEGTRKTHNISSRSRGGGEKKGSAHGRPAKGEAFTIEELAAQLGDVLFRRAQCKLMIGVDAVVIESALKDALEAVAHVPDDNDYELAVATCHIRLKQFRQGMKSLRVVLDRSPENEKALYHYAFCQRAEGRQKDAIEGLTKIIASVQANSSHNSSSLAIPLERVYETRGTLFHEIHAHKLALADLGRAVAMNPERPENYYLRGDCNSKLGNYEQALADFILAEEKEFPDMCSLATARGMVYRLLGQSDNARKDFETALLLIEEGGDNNSSSSRMAKIRLNSLRALCFLDLGMFNAGYSILEGTVDMVSTMEMRVEHGLPPDFKDEGKQKKSSAAPKSVVQAGEVQDEVKEGDEASTINMANETSLKASDLVAVASTESVVIDRQALVMVRRLKWILCYHAALALHMQKKFAQAESVLKRCVAVHMRACAPDAFVLGAACFYLGVEQCQIGNLDEAEASLKDSLDSKWGQVDKNKTLITFAIAKLYQQQKRHVLAVEEFGKSIEADQANAHAYFRRAWSQKALGNYVEAGSDFETAKKLRSNDPNFQIDYKRISTLEYMMIDTEPDVSSVFPTLLPAPNNSTI